MALAGCRQGDDVVATLRPTAADSSVISMDGDVARPDTASEVDAPSVTSDREVPPIDVERDTVVTPPSNDAAPPTGCDGPGPILSIQRRNGDKSAACAGQLAAHTFTHALCACEDVNIGTTLATGSFDSSMADKSTVLAGAAVGIAGSYLPNSSTISGTTNSSVGGSLTVAGTARTPFVARGLEVQGDLRLAGSATITTQLTVKRDAWLVSLVGYLGSVNIGGALYTSPPAGGLTGIGPYMGSPPIPITFTVGDPCGCSEPRLDVVGMETAGGEKNDNAARRIEQSALNKVTTGTKLELRCGRFRFDSIGGAGSLQLKILGRTAIFVDGNVDLTDIDFQLSLDPGAELDWFVRGNFAIGSRLGDPTRPSATRIYVGGSADISLASGLIGANVYAPNANMTITATTVSGSFYGKTVNVPDSTFIRYDRSILNYGAQCEPTAPCDQCQTCNGGTACVNQGCNACRDDADCCLPLVCNQGACQPLLR